MGNVQKIHNGNIRQVFHQAGLIPCIIPRADVESGDIQPAWQFLKKINQKKHLWTNRDALVLYFAGYEEDTRAYFQIPEFVRYFRNLSQSWNYWLWFLNAKNPENIRMVLSCHLPNQLLSDAAQTPEDQYAVPVQDDLSNQVSSIMNRLCADTETLLCKAGRDPKIAHKLTLNRLDLWLPILGLSLPAKERTS